MLRSNNGTSFPQQRFSLNLTALMLTQMKKNERTTKYLYLNLAFDIIARANFIYFIIIAAIYDT